MFETFSRSKPAAANNSTAIAISQTTIDLNRRRGPPPPRSSSFSASVSRVRDVSNAGASPHRRLVSSVKNRVKNNARVSRAGLENEAIVVRPVHTTAGAWLEISSTPHSARATPMAPAGRARMRLSVSNWRTIRARPDPIAIRMASSRRLILPRARSSPATFAHVISSTHPAAARSSITERRSAGSTRACPIVCATAPHLEPSLSC